MAISYQQTANGIFVPGSPGINCSICGEDIPKPAFASHVEHCYSQHESKIQAEAELQSNPIFDHDTELQDWMKRKGQQG